MCKNRTLNKFHVHLADFLGPIILCVAITITRKCHIEYKVILIPSITGLQKCYEMKMHSRQFLFNHTHLALSQHVYNTMRYMQKALNPISFYYGDLTPEEFLAIQQSSEEGQSFD